MGSVAQLENEDLPSATDRDNEPNKYNMMTIMFQLWDVRCQKNIARAVLITASVLPFWKCLKVGARTPIQQYLRKSGFGVRVLARLRFLVSEWQRQNLLLSHGCEFFPYAEA